MRDLTTRPITSRVVSWQALSGAETMRVALGHAVVDGGAVVTRPRHRIDLTAAPSVPRSKPKPMATGLPASSSTLQRLRIISREAVPTPLRQFSKSKVRYDR